ncbi:hypothetical protein [Winogradskyella schleiferi]|nr:hypothetical protein [Winogradskyella schleiferi]
MNKSQNQPTNWTPLNARIGKTGMSFRISKKKKGVLNHSAKSNTSS